MTVQFLLSKLEKVKSRGTHQWMACCPVHGDKTPSLSIKDDDGKVLIHCFGCGAGGVDVAAALGVDLSELFPPSDDYDASKHKHGDRVYFDAKKVLEALAFEATVVYFAAKEAQKGALNPDDMARLGKAVSNINAALEYVRR